VLSLEKQKVRTSARGWATTEDLPDPAPVTQRMRKKWPADSIVESLFQNAELFRSRALFFGLDSLDSIPPESVALITDSVSGADGFEAVLLALFEYN